MNKNLTNNDLQEIRTLDVLIEELSPSIFWLLDDKERNIVDYMSEMLKIQRGLINGIIPEKYPKIKVRLDDKVKELVLAPSDVITLMNNFFEGKRDYIKVSNEPKDWLKESLYRKLYHYDDYHITRKTENILMSHEYGNLLANLLSGYKCLEIGSNTGIISKVLQDRGVECICTGDKVSNREIEWTDVTEIDPCTAIEVYGAEVEYVILHYPWMVCESTTKTLNEYMNLIRETNPNCKLITIGGSRFPDLHSEPTAEENAVMLDINNLYIDSYIYRYEESSNHIEIYN